MISRNLFICCILDKINLTIYYYQYDYISILKNKLPLLNWFFIKIVLLKKFKKMDKNMISRNLFLCCILDEINLTIYY